MPDISATQFFDENPLFTLLELKDGAMGKSFKSIMNNYILECKECGQQVEQRGNSKFKCRRCKRLVTKDEDGEWEIIEPEGDEEVKAELAMLKPPKVLVAREEDGTSDEDDDVIVAEKKRGKKIVPVKDTPDDDAMIAFLTGTAKKTSGTRILEAKERRQAEEEADIDEPVVKKTKPVTKETKPVVKEDKPVAKEVKPVAKATAPEPKKTPVPENKGCPEAKEVMMKVVELSPGQTFYCAATKTLYIGKE